MSTDIKLHETEVHLEGYRTVAKSADFCLDYLERRPNTNSNDLRIALVHDFNDGLTINWGNTYPGGVKIDSPVSIPSNLAANSIDATTINVTSINARNITIDVIEFDMAGPEKRMEHPLGVFLGILQARMEALEALNLDSRLRDLENRIRILEEDKRNK